MLRTKAWAIAAVFAWRFMQVWNQENGAVQRSANFTLAFLTATSNKGHGKLTGGAFFLALEHLNANQSDNNVTAYFNYVFRDTQNMDTTAMRAMVDTHCSDLNVSVYIGPPDFCGNAALLATAFDVPYISYDCNEMHTLMRNMTDYLIINEEPSGVYVSKFITALLQAFGWESYWVVTGQEGVTNVWGDTTKILSSLGHKYGITRNGITHETLNDVYKTDGGDDRPYFHIVRQTFDKTRVYVFLGNYNGLVDFLRELQQVTDKRRGEYVVVAVDDHKSTRNAQFYFLRNDESNQNATEAEVSAFRNVLILKMRQAAPELKDFSNEVYERNYRPPVNLSRPPGFLLLNNAVSLAQPKLRPEVFYIYDAVMHYGQAVRELLMSGQDAHNGTLVIDKLRNSKRKSIQGFEVFINEEGESEGSYVVMSMATQDSDMWQVGNFTVNLLDSSVSYTPGSNPITWIDGTPPPSQPPCGFQDENCDGEPAALADFDHPDWIQTLKLAYNKGKKTKHELRSRKALTVSKVCPKSGCGRQSSSTFEW